MIGLQNHLRWQKQCPRKVFSLLNSNTTDGRPTVLLDEISSIEKPSKADKILETTPKKVETPTRKKLSQQLKRARIESDDDDADASPIRGRRNKKQKKEWSINF